MSEDKNKLNNSKKEKYKKKKKKFKPIPDVNIIRDLQRFTKEEVEKKSQVDSEKED